VSFRGDRIARRWEDGPAARAGAVTWVRDGGTARRQVRGNGAAAAARAVRPQRKGSGPGPPPPAARLP